MATLSLGITPSLDKIKDGRIPVELPRDYTLKSHWPDGSGMVAGIESECRSDSRRNGGRFPVGIVVGFVRNTQIDYLLRKALRQAGYPDEHVEHAHFQWRGSGFMPGVDLAKNYAVPDQHRRFRRLHVRIFWRNAQGDPIELSGPLCIGGGRFTGLGLFTPQK